MSEADDVKCDELLELPLAPVEFNIVDQRRRQETHCTDVLNAQPELQLVERKFHAATSRVLTLRNIFRSGAYRNLFKLSLLCVA